MKYLKYIDEHVPRPGQIINVSYADGRGMRLYAEKIEYFDGYFDNKTILWWTYYKDSEHIDCTKEEYIRNAATFFDKLVDTNQRVVKESRCRKKRKPSVSR
jgi:hypothetical protein